MWKLLSAVVLLSVLVIINSQTSPCPGTFEYESSGPGHWVGSLNVLSDHKLYGTWIRLIFDRPVKDVEVDNNELSVAYRNNSLVLLKNRDLILLKGKPVKVQFKVNYEGTNAPALVRYLLNARSMCPESDD